MDVYCFKKFKEEKGFTLVELLIAIIVLAVLAGLAVRTFTFLTDRARESATETEMGYISKALQIYITDQNTYPDEADFPDALETAGIMLNVPELDNWQNPYQYSSADGTSYVLESYGIDEADGGGDDIVYTDGALVEDGAYPNG